MFILVGEEGGWEQASPEDIKAEMDRWESFGREAVEAGVMVAGDGLQESSTATTLRIQDQGEPIVSDGPFAETKEQIGGILILEANDLDHAIQLMSKHPGVRVGPFEIRPAADLNEMIRDSERRRSAEKG
jgi:hypothetical protein